MSNFLQTLIPLLSIALALASSPARTQGDPTTFNYDFLWWDRPSTFSYQGDAYFASDTNYLRMTKTGRHGEPLGFKAGRAVHTAPIKFWEAGAQLDFETTIKFIIYPEIADTNPADGFTFFIAPVGFPLGSTGGNFGIFNATGKNPSVFAVEFDIFSNPGMDPGYRHIGIDIESNVSKNTTNVGGAFLLEQEVTTVIDVVTD